MDFLCTNAADCIDIWRPELLAALLSGLLTLIGTVLSVSIAAYLTYRFAIRHSKNQHDTEIRVERLRREIDALEGVWELLAYMTDRESANAIIRWRKRDGDKRYYVHFENLRAFLLSKVSETFYARHAGLHIPSAISTQLFEYHNILMQLYLCYSDTPPEGGDPLIELENPELIKKLLTGYRNLNAGLKGELASRYRLLSIDDE